jgi:COP9 signalosome complex subunit 3
VLRHLKALCGPYNDFATSYATGSNEDLEKNVAANLEVFQKDNNYGLVKQCCSALVRRNIQKLTKTYLTLSLQAIAEQVGLSDVKLAEQYVLHMIEDDEIFARIDQKDGMVMFLEDPQQFNTTETVAVLDAEIQKSMTLARKLQAVDEQISCHPAYIYKTQVANERQGSAGGFGEGGMMEGMGMGVGL